MKLLLENWREYLSERIVSADEYNLNKLSPTWFAMARTAAYMSRWSPSAGERDRTFKKDLEKRIYDKFFKGKRVRGKLITGIDFEAGPINRKQDPDSATPEYLKGWRVQLHLKVRGGEYSFGNYPEHREEFEKVAKAEEGMNK